MSLKLTQNDLVGFSILTSMIAGTIATVNTAMWVASKKKTGEYGIRFFGWAAIGFGCAATPFYSMKVGVALLGTYAVTTAIALMAWDLSNR